MTLTETRLVPVEPTEVMIEAFRDWYALHFGRAILKGKARKIVARILAAAPAALPPREEAPEGAGDMVVMSPCQHCLRMTTVTPESLSLYRDHLRAQPQPERGEASGETREAVGKIVERAVLRAGNRVIGVKDIRQRSAIAGEETDVAANAILALIRPAPVAGEGVNIVQWFKPSVRQPESGKKFVALHEDGSGAWLGFMHDGGIIDADGDDFSETLKGVAYWAYLPTGFEFFCEGYQEDPITLPGHVCPPIAVRSEALDEGAAGSDCASCFGSGKDAGSQFNACPECDGKGRIASVHPSPTPAADDDRLRVAVAREVKTWADTRWPKTHGVGSKSWVDGLTNRILAALDAEVKE